MSRVAELEAVLHKIIGLTEEIYTGVDTMKGRQTIFNIQKAYELAREAVGLPTTRSRLARMKEGTRCLVAEDGTVVGVELVEEE